MSRRADPPDHAGLPVVPGAPDGSSWGVWGADDVHGALNRLSPDAVLGGVAEVRRGLVFPLDVPLSEFSPPLFSRAAVEHRVLGDDNSLGRDDLISNWNTQASSQWDGFRHVRDPEHGYYNGLPGDRHEIAAWARRGLAGRALLLDVPRSRERAGLPWDAGAATPIDVDELQRVVLSQGTPPRAGDVLLVRTGWLAHYRGLDEPGRRAAAERKSLRAPGLLADRSVAEWLWDHRIAAVAADNPSLETYPLGTGAAPGEPILHVRLLARLGIPIGELWDLEALAADCAAERTYCSLLVSAPLALAGGCGSPANAVALR
ncbi:cyclase family protein [Dactylosporangium sp. CA-139066]|uniref:cyclase family protein n=1 Tax=Dactylosporangium sp. CA-139066 TaxID=3239930 RepID=UPI003D8A2037